MSPPIGSAAWIDAELRARLGEGATIGEIAFEGKRCVVTGARAPIGGAVVAIDRAEIELGAGAPIGSLPLSARLVSLRGEITMDAIGLRAPVELEGAGAGEPRWFLGDARVRGATALGAPFEVDARVEIGADGARVAGRVRVEEAPLFGDVVLSAAPAIEIDLATRGPIDAASPAIDGRVRAARISIGRRSSPDAACRFDEVSAVIDLDARRLRYRDLSARAHGARIGAWGRVPIAPPSIEAAAVPLAAIAFEHAGGGLFASLGALAGITVRASRAPIADREVRAIPWDSTASGEIVVARGRAVSAAIVASTPRSELRLRVPATTGALEGATLRGRLAVEDGIVLGIFARPVCPRPEVILDVDARLTGSIAAPGLTGRVGASRVILDVSADPSHPSFTLDEVSALIDVSRDAFAWSRFTGRLYGGTFSSSGRVGLGLDAVVRFESVRVEALPTQAEGASKLAALIEGAASGEVTFTRHAVERAKVKAEGGITIAEPRYLFVRALAPNLARFGLPRVPSRGRGPLSLRVALVREDLIVDRIACALDGVEVSGNVRARLDDGRLDGALTLHVQGSYLAKSPLLTVPAALAGRVIVPVTIGGTTTAPVIDTNAWAILEALLVDNRVGDAVKSVLDTIGEWGRRGR